MKIPAYIFIFAFIFFSCNHKKKKEYQDPNIMMQSETAEIAVDSLIYLKIDDVFYPAVGNTYTTKMYADAKITFEIEELQRPTTLLKEDSISKLFEKIIKAEYTKGRRNFFDTLQIDHNIRGHYKGRNTLVNYGNRSFFWGMYNAYSDHRPFILSPNMIWLLITQGFANHVNNNSEELRDLFVNFEDKALLSIRYSSEFDSIDDFTWENIFSQFPQQITHFTGDELINILSSNFSTTSSINKTVSEITIMSALEPYFAYEAGIVACGIPEITLEGTPEDWQAILDKVQYLKKYKLDWWIKELEPVLKQLIKTSKGNINKNFWKDMFKVHREEMCGDPDKVDGWIVKFFPYMANGKRTDLKTINIDDEIASEIVKVDLNYFFSDGVRNITIPLEIWAGFTGLRQDTATYALKPDIGWMVRKKDTENPVIKYYFSEDDPDKIYAFTTSVIPDDFLKIKEARSVYIDFTGEIIIPDEMAKIKIKELHLTGQITDKEIKRICNMFPNTHVKINYDEYNKK